MKKKLWEAANR